MQRMSNAVLCSSICQRRYVQTYAINSSFLDNGITSHEHAWFWGMLLTDGYIRISSKTREVSWHQKYDIYPTLEKIRNIAGSTHPITFSIPSSQGDYVSCRLIITSTRLATQAQILLGCHQSRKTFELQFPADVDPALMPSLIRGIHDGDGCWEISLSKIQSESSMTFSIASANAEFLRSIQVCINQHALNTSGKIGSIISEKGKRCGYLKYFKQELLQAIRRWSYRVDNLDNAFMHQKYDRFKFFENVFMQKHISRVDRKVAIEQYRAKEQRAQENTLNELIRMCNGEISRPGHFHFAPAFVRKFAR